MAQTPNHRPEQGGKHGLLSPHDKARARALLSSFYGTGDDSAGGGSTTDTAGAGGAAAAAAPRGASGSAGPVGSPYPGHSTLHLQTDEGLDDGIQRDDAATIDAQVGRWIGEQLRAKSLLSLLETVNALAADAATLEADQQDLVYEDYHKLTSVIGVLEDMTSALDAMEDDVGRMAGHIETLIQVVDADAESDTPAGAEQTAG